MATASAGQQLTRRERVGNKVEDWASERFSLDVDRHALIDCPEESIEIKAAQEWHRTWGSNGPRRRGRFSLEREQHNALLEAEGQYLFVLYAPFGDRLLIRDHCFVDATDVPFRDGLSHDKLHPQEVGL